MITMRYLKKIIANTELDRIDKNELEKDLKKLNKDDLAFLAAVIIGGRSKIEQQEQGEKLLELWEMQVNSDNKALIAYILQKSTRLSEYITHGIEYFRLWLI